MLSIVGGIVLWIFIVIGMFHVIKSIIKAGKTAKGNEPE